MKYVLNIKKYIFFLLTLLVIAACSTQRNTGITRAYHNVTSRYNILFNGEESFKKGMITLKQSYDHNYNQLLPVFLYTDQDQLSAIGPEMDRSIKKATKLISMHSLTVKPEYDTDKELSAKQKEFLSKKEYNKYVDDAYLLMGKAHFYKMEYPRARETFNYVVANFGENNSVYEAQMWLARLAIEQTRYREAEEMLIALDRNIEFPKDLKGELHATMADLYIDRENYKEAINYLQSANEESRDKVSRTRYHYILAQLYLQVDQQYLASEEFSKVIRMNPPYKMAFNAKISRALSVQAGTSESKDVEKQLKKMLRDDKNIEFQDQIYYALGNLYFRQNKTEKAVEYYKESLLASSGDMRQKARTNLTLADIYYARPDYINAQAYYDSAVAIIDAEYPNYDLIYTKSVSLTQLVEHFNTVEFEDSVLALSYRPRSEIDDMIEDMIYAKRQAEEQARLAEQERALEAQDTRNEIANLAQSGGGFYFYNTTVKSQGKKEFLRTWGNRKLEDNWRRSNKSTVAFAEAQAEDQNIEAEGEIVPGEVVTDDESPKFYLQYIPFSDSAKEASKMRIANALFRMGEIYSEELKDYPRATESFEEFIRRFPTHEKKLQAYFNIYTIAKAQEDKERVSKYQQRIISEFPESNYAKLMTNPNYVQEILAAQQKVYNDYENTYSYFSKGDFNRAGYLSQQAMKEYPEHKIYPQFDYIYTVSTGLQKDTLSFIKDLQAFGARYPNSEVAQNATMLIDYLQNEKPEVIVQQNIEIARDLYTFDPSEKHYFAYLVPKSLNTSQLNFNILDFNYDNYIDVQFKIKRIELNKAQNLMLVEDFENAEAAREYLAQISSSERIFRDVNPSGAVPIIISQSNYRALTKAGDSNQYMLFYRENY